jgi:hypothetical protein
VASKFVSLLRKRGVLLVVMSAVSALLTAKGGHPGPQFGFWDGPI